MSSLLGSVTEVIMHGAKAHVLVVRYHGGWSSDAPPKSSLVIFFVS